MDISLLRKGKKKGLLNIGLIMVLVRMILQNMVVVFVLLFQMISLISGKGLLMI